MIPISSAVASAKSGWLVWSKIPHKRGYELKSNGEAVALLQKTSCWSSEFHAEAQQGQWRFRRAGFWRTEIADANSGVSIAAFKPNWSGGGTLVFTDGETFQLAHKGFWRPIWTVRAQNGQAVLSLDARARTVELSDEPTLGKRGERLTLLAIFVWHMMRQAAEDSASVAAVVAATS
jgi:hypothetical protein